MKIDFSKIEGFAGMSAEEKLKALEELDIDAVPKAQFDKAASEAAGYKKQLREKQSEEEKAEADRNAKYTEMESKYNELLKSSTISGYKAKFVAQGYDEKLAEDTAQAMYDNDTAKVFANQQKFLDEYSKKLKSDALHDMTPPAGGNSGEKEASNVEMAKALGKASAESAKASSDVLAYYISKGAM